MKWFPKNLVKRLIVMSKKLPDTSSHFVQLEFHESTDDRIKGKKGYTGCPENDEFIQSLLKSHEGSARKIGRARRGNGRGGGRGRSGNRKRGLKR